MHRPSAAMAPSGMRDASEAYNREGKRGQPLSVLPILGLLVVQPHWLKPTSCLEGLVELEMGFYIPSFPAALPKFCLRIEGHSSDTAGWEYLPGDGLRAIPTIRVIAPLEEPLTANAVSFGMLRSGMQTVLALLCWSSKAGSSHQFWQVPAVAILEGHMSRV